jgi:membrane protease YdiL (CAAX protease family)
MKRNLAAALIVCAMLTLAPGLRAADAAEAQDPGAPTPEAPEQHGRVGCQLTRAKDSNFTIAYVAAMSPAAKAGLKVGDTVTAIDDIPAAKLSRNDAVHFLCGTVGGIVTLTLHRNGEPDQRVTLTRRPYLEVYTPAEQAGDAEAQYAVGYYFEYYNSASDHWTVAAQWLQKAADQGNARAEADLGYLYVYGYGVAQDPKLALSWYQKAAQQDDELAEYRLAELYSWGYGVPKSDVDAYKWNLRAAQHGNAKAECAVGNAYEYGRGVAQDFHQAFTWYQRSAEHGNAYGAWGVSYMYETGHGVPRDLAEAYRWIRVAHDAMPDDRKLTKSMVMLSLAAFVETRDSSSVDLTLFLSVFHREILIAFLVLLFIYLAIGISLLVHGLMTSTYPPSLFKVFGWAVFLLESQFVAVFAIFLFGRTLSADLLLVALVVLGVVPLVLSSFGKTRRLVWRPVSVSWKVVLLSCAGAYAAFVLSAIGYHLLTEAVTGGDLPAQPTMALIGKTKDSSTWVAYTSIALAFPMAEEILFRGYFFDALRRRFSALFAIVTTAFCFSLYHFQGFYILPLFCFGLMLGWVKSRTDSIFPCVALHALSNALMLAVSV